MHEVRDYSRFFQAVETDTFLYGPKVLNTWPETDPQRLILIDCNKRIVARNSKVPENCGDATFGRRTSAGRGMANERVPSMFTFDRYLPPQSTIPADFG